MSWTPTLGPWAWLLGVVLAGIILLYFLKLRREPMKVSSTYLWAKSIEDLHVNSLFQKLKRSLLLLLQLLVVVLALIAVFRPSLRGETGSEGRLVFLLDVSASMQAKDMEDGESRYQVAKKLIAQRIEVMQDSETAMLLAFSDRAETLQSFTSDRRRLLDALESVSVSNRSTDVMEALRAAEGLANPRRSSQVGDVADAQVADALPAELLIYSDGIFPNVNEFSLGNLVPTFISIGQDRVRNLAITAFSAERNLENPTEVQVFATIENLGTEKLESDVTLSLGGDFLDADRVTLDAQEQAGLSFELSVEGSATLELQIDSVDHLLVDNIAYAGLAPTKMASVLVVTEGNTPLRVGLATEQASRVCRAEFVSPSYLSTDNYLQRSIAGTDDLIIFDRCSPSQMPETNTFFIGALPTTGVLQEGSLLSGSPDEPAAIEQVGDSTNTGEEQIRNSWSWDGDPSGLVIVDLDRTHPVMRYLELFSLLIFNGRAINLPDGGSELLSADIGTVLGIAPRDGYQDVVLGFEVISDTEDGTAQANTNWYAERSWPVFLLNVLRSVAGASEVSSANSYRPGETMRTRLAEPRETVTVRSTRDQEVDLALHQGSLIEVVDTDTPGNFRIESDGDLMDLYSINLFAATESSLKPVRSLELGYESVTAAAVGLEDQKEYWRLALLLMLAVLLTEWWLYSKRIA
ncbi:VWA domain-containing protein [bacterium]|nr:VWA domain-containing protein [bacterium]